MAQDFAQGCPKGHFNHLWLAVRHIVVDCQYLRPTSCGRSYAGEGFRAGTYDHRHISERLDTVYGGWLFPPAILWRGRGGVFWDTTTPPDKGKSDGFLTPP